MRVFERGGEEMRPTVPLPLPSRSSDATAPCSRAFFSLKSFKNLPVCTPDKRAREGTGAIRGALQQRRAWGANGPLPGPLGKFPNILFSLPNNESLAQRQHPPPTPHTHREPHKPERYALHWIRGRVDQVVLPEQGALLRGQVAKVHTLPRCQ